MAEKTEISWTDATWSPWEGCTKVSPGCENCYAAGMNNWLRKGQNWGPGAPRREYSADHWVKPIRWNRADFRECASCGWRGERFKSAPTGCPACGTMGIVPASRRVFPSVCDPFDNEVDPAWRARFFAMIASTPNLTWLLLTKRIGNVPKMLVEAHTAYARDTGSHWAGAANDCWDDMPANVWLGATVVNQEEADRDIPKLLAVPARVRFLSIEPMLGPVYLSGVHLQPQVPAINWVICGGESGPKARPMPPDWARSLRDQCAAAGVPLHFKQWGEWAPYNRGRDDLRIDDPMQKFGKALAGRLLDGRTHDEFPS